MATMFKKKGVWYLDYYFNGRRVRKSLKTNSKRVARLALNDLEVKMAKNDLGLLVKDTSLEKHLEDFLAYKKTRLTPTAFRRLEVSLNSHLAPFFREHHVQGLKHITPWLIEKYLALRVEKKVKMATLNHELCALKNMLTMAVEWNRLTTNPASKIKYFKVTDRKVPRFLSLDEIDALLANLHGMWFVFAFTAIHTGMRLGELLQLEWQDIDFENEKIQVAHDGRRHTKSKKTRYLPINQELLHVLKNHKETQKAQDGDRIFPVSSSEPREHIYGAYEKAGIKGACIHTLRHTFASQMVMHGVDLYTTSKLLGHTDIKTTQVYAHLAQDHLKMAMGKFPKLGTLRALPEKSPDYSVG